MKPVRYSWRWVADACEVDFGDIRGQELAKRALLLAAAGGHNVLMVGPPGTGKTLLARALAGILPPLTREESLAVTSLYSVAGELSGEQGFVLKRPFRKPHHGASGVSLVGGGAIPKPGEVSLAHRGVLFLDELPEFSRQVLDQLRQPIEDGEIVVSRAQQTVAFPAQSMVVAAMNPCKCGYLGSRRRDCSCASGEVLRYQRRVSGPLLDRFDLHVVVEDIGAAQLLEKREQRPVSKQWQQLAVAARRQQASRQHKLNEQLSAREVGQYCVIAPDAQRLIEQAEQKFTLSGRAIHRTLKVARTIADLAHEPNIKARHVGEALQYREQLRAALPNFV